ncbi:MAG: DUF2155 domain-containing protein [Deferribacteraceae bacterium]|jgi:hypothetical protein|nr:DUF2155 domain-containing protein [Deferribacteraceae bacterium]
MKKLSVMFLCTLLIFLAACSQNSGKKGAGAGQGTASTQDVHGTDENDAELTGFVFESDEVDPSILALYTGITVKLTDRESKESRDIFIPFMTPTQLEGTPLTVTVTQFFPDFVMSEKGSATRSLEPKNPGAKVKITGANPEFEGWLFSNFPDAHPYDNPDFDIAMVNAVEK